MRLLDKHIAKTITGSIAFVTLLLAGLQVFILFVKELNDLGKVDYGVSQAICFVLLQLPYQVYLFFPMACLLGCLIGLGRMAAFSELIVIRSAGMSVEQVTWVVLKVAVFSILLVSILAEILVPRLSELANNRKIQALTGGQALRTTSGVWLREHNDFIFIGVVHSNNILENVYQFHFDEQHHLSLARKMTRITYTNGFWHAYNIAETSFHETSTSVLKKDEMVWDVSLNPNLLSVSSHSPDEMTLSALHRYLRTQKYNHQHNGFYYRLSFCQRLIQPFSSLVMTLLAIPFIFGPLRSSTMGSKVILGVTVGFCFHIINRSFGPISQVFQWSPNIAAFAPTIVFALFGVYLMNRVR